MNNHYRAPISGKRSLATAVIAPVVLAAGVYVALDRPSISVPAVVTPPDTAQRFTKSEPVYAPSADAKSARLLLFHPSKSHRARWVPACSSARKPTAR